MKFKSVIPAINFISKTKFKFDFPNSFDVVIIDKEGSEVFIEYLVDYNYFVLDVRGESLNFWVILYTFFKGNWNFSGYVSNFLKFISPKLVITYIDNTTFFYELKRFCPNIVFISIQNGWRDNVLFDILEELKLGKLKQFKCDYILCFGKIVANKFNHHIDAEVLPIGSFKSNSIQKKMHQSSGPVIYLSQYRTPVNSINGLSMPVGDKNINWDLFYNAEKIVLPIIKDFCKKNDLEFIICGGPDPDFKSEEAFYKFLLGENDWKFEKREATNDNYLKIDKAKLVTFIDSTLGYEALGRGSKVVAFPIRGNFINKNDRGFGNSEIFPIDGFFWTTSLDFKYYEKILSNVININDEDWVKETYQIIKDVMQFDIANNKFKQILNKHLN